MSKISKITALLVSILVIASVCLTGCAQTAGTTAKATGGSQITPEDVSTSPVTLSCFIDLTWFPCDKFEGIMPEAITERTGVTLDLTIAADSNQLGLLIASGDLQDLVLVSNFPPNPILSQLSSPEVCIPYNELIEEYAPYWDPGKIRISNALSFSQDDNYYCILRQTHPSKEEWVSSGAVPPVPTLAYRLDMLEKLNMPLKSLDDLLNVYAKVKETVPDSICLTFNQFHKFKCFKTWIGAQDLEWLEQDGKVVYMIHGDKYKDYLRFINNLFRKGYILESNFSYADDYSGNTKVFSSVTWTQNCVWPMNMAVQKLDPNAHFVESMPLSDEYPYQSSTLGWYGVFITKNCKNPERAIQYMAWCFTEEGDRLTSWGREGIEYTLDERDWPIFSKDWMDSVGDANAFYKKYAPWFNFGGSSIVESIGKVASIPKDEYDGFYKEPYEKIASMFYENPWFTASLPPADTDEAITMNKITDITNKAETAIMLSRTDAEFEQNFAKLLSDADKLGIQELEEYLTKKVAEVKKNYQ